MKLNRAEIDRKILHFIFGLLIPGVMFYSSVWVRYIPGLPRTVPPRVYTILLFLGLTILMLIVEFLRLKVTGMAGLFARGFGSMMRREESRKFTGATHMVISALICSMVFYNYPHISAMVLSTFIWGDAVAALVGLSIGRIRIGRKSLEGSLACFLLCLAMYFLLFPLVPGLLSAWGGRMPLAPALTGSLCVTLLELFPVRIGRIRFNDNLIVPVLTGVALVLMQP